MTMIPGIEPDELAYIQNLTRDFTDDQFNMFLSIYAGRRKAPDTILLCTILGFVVVAGIQRFLLGQVGMGLLYLFTGGLCLIGTIIDLVNHKSLAFEYNQKAALEAMHMVRR